MKKNFFFEVHFSLITLAYNNTYFNEIKITFFLSAIHKEKRQNLFGYPTIVRRSNERGAVVADNSPRARKHGL